MKMFFLMIGLHIQGFFRGLLGVNDDMLLVRNDFTKLIEEFTKLGDNFNTINTDLWSVFNGLPFAASIQSMSAADAAALTNPKVIEGNSLLGVLTSILLAARQGHSQLQVFNGLGDEVRKALTKRGFRIEDPVGSEKAGGQVATFITWT